MKKEATKGTDGLSRRARSGSASAHGRGARRPTPRVRARGSAPALRRCAASSLRRSPRGFTIVELIVAVVIVAGIAGAVTVSISQALRAGRVSGSRASAVLRADAAAGRIARDVQDVVREGDLYLARVLIRDKAKDGMPRDEILVFANLMELARPTSDSPEGGTYEVQYRVSEDMSDARERVRRGERPEMVLWRRVDPIPDDNTLGGGVVFPVVEGVEALSIQAFDGDQWLNEWDSDRDGYPHAVRIEVVARSADGKRVEAVRRVVAIDRVPAVYFKERVEGAKDEGGGQ